jgi:hypothetical protein
MRARGDTVEQLRSDIDSGRTNDKVQVPGRCNVANQVRSEAMQERRREDPDRDRHSEDDKAREELGPRGVPGEPDPPRMTPERKKKTPTRDDGAPEHTA